LVVAEVATEQVGVLRVVGVDVEAAALVGPLDAIPGERRLAEEVVELVDELARGPGRRWLVVGLGIFVAQQVGG
jgi:hypothetical protein